MKSSIHELKIKTNMNVCKTFFLYALPGLLLLGSCKKNFLDRQPTYTLSNSSLYSDSTDVIAAINGCYSGWNNPSLTGNQGWADAYNVLYMDACSDNTFSQYPWEGF